MSQSIVSHSDVFLNRAHGSKVLSGISELMAFVNDFVLERSPFLSKPILFRSSLKPLKLDHFHFVSGWKQDNYMTHSLNIALLSANTVL